MHREATDRDRLAAALADPETGWTLGAFGAAAEFHRDRDEAAHPLDEDRLGLRTPRGGLALHLPRDLRPVAYETPIGDGWSHAVALCLPEQALDPRPCTRVSELGPDRDALDPARQDDILFDLGFGSRQVAVCIRAEEPALLDELRARIGGTAPDFDAEIRLRLAASSASLVFLGPLGRLEVQSGGLDPAPGPRAYVVPRILRLRRSHAATAPIPRGLVPCAYLHPPHPCRDHGGQPIPFDHGRHTAFQAMLARWGDPVALAFKARVLAGEHSAHAQMDRRMRAVERVARAQAVHTRSQD